MKFLLSIFFLFQSKNSVSSSFCFRHFRPQKICNAQRRWTGSSPTGASSSCDLDRVHRRRWKHILLQQVELPAATCLPLPPICLQLSSEIQGCLSLISWKLEILMPSWIVADEHLAARRASLFGNYRTALSPRRARGMLISVLERATRRKERAYLQGSHQARNPTLQERRASIG